MRTAYCSSLQNRHLSGSGWKTSSWKTELTRL